MKKKNNKKKSNKRRKLILSKIEEMSNSNKKMNYDSN